MMNTQRVDTNIGDGIRVMSLKNMINALQNVLDTYGDCQLSIEAGRTRYLGASISVSGVGGFTDAKITCEEKRG